MSWILLSADMVELVHDALLNPGELPGRARDKSLEEALARVENRLAYGLIGDVFDLASAYAVVVATGHCFNDGNKRTAHQVMDLCLDLHGIALTWNMQETGDLIIRTARGRLHEDALADWLRARAR